MPRDINKFGEEDIANLCDDKIKILFEKIINNKLISKKAKYEVGAFKYTNDDILDIDIFQMFIRLIYCNNDFPENKTIIYKKEVLNCYADGAWIPFKNNCIIIITEMIFYKIVELISNSKFLKSVTTYNFDLFSDDDIHVKCKYHDLLIFILQNKFNIHQFNFK